jgi:uncharacterized repeat protein (TIGR01451 family)
MKISFERVLRGWTISARALLWCAAAAALTLASGALARTEATNLSYATGWSQPHTDPAIAAFDSWASQFAAAPGAVTRTQMLPDGLSLARQRRAALAELIKSNPQEALASAVPVSVRRQLPPDLAAELETRVSGIGELSVLGVLQAKGGPAVRPVERFVRLGERTYHAYVHGRRASQTSKSGIPLSGIAIGDVLAVHESVIRELESGETPEPSSPVIEVKSPSGPSAPGLAPVLGEVGSKIYRFASFEQQLQAEIQLEGAEGGINPAPTQSAATVLEQGGQSPATSGGPPAPGPPSVWTTGLKNVLIIRVDFSDLSGDPVGWNDTSPLSNNNTDYTAPYVQNVADSRISPYYLKSSYGLTSLTNTVTTKVYRMPQTAVAYATGDLNDQLHVDAEAAASADYNVASYDRILVLFSFLGNIPGSFITYGGLAQIVGKNVWLNGEFDFRVVAHEVGHTYGLFHAGLWLVTDGNPISATGTTIEYGDDFDTMGANFANDANTDFSGRNKNILGWLPDSKVLTITTNGVYRIYAFDWANYVAATNAPVLALTLGKDGERTYWIGARRNFTSNPTMEHGAYIVWGLNSVGAGGGGGFSSQLLDLNTPGTAPIPRVNSDYDAALTIGQTFTDPAISLILKPIAEGGVSPNNYLDIQIGEATDLQVLTNYVSGGNGNGVIDNNECNDLSLLLTNRGSLTATHIQTTLSTTNVGVILTHSKSDYPDLPAGASAMNLVAFQISTEPSLVCGTPIDFTLVVKCDQATFTNQFRLPTGVPGTPLRFDNSTPAFIPDLGEADSSIVVSNLNSALSKVTVALYITHTFDSDLLLQLISPDGTTNTLSANNGSSGHNYGAGCSPDDQRTTFDDAALQPIAGATAPFVGSFQPKTPLSVFVGKVGTNVNGTWKLRAVDQVARDFGTLQCWSLFLTPTDCKDGGGECPGADLALGMTAQPDPVIVGNNLTYTITVTNGGPSTARNVTVTHLLPSSVIFVSAVASQGSCAQAGGLVTGNLGTLAPGAGAIVTVVGTASTAGTVSSTASVTSNQSDPDTSNNSATVVSHVIPASADLMAGIAAVPNLIVLGGTLTYTVTVTNRGPSDSSGVIVGNALPPNAVVLSATVSQGSISPGANLWTVGTLPVGAGAAAIITVAPTQEGLITATSTAQGDQLDPVPANNTATVTTVVGPAADLAISITDFPDPTVVSSNVTYLVVVTNRGPSAATGVTVNDFLPANVPVISTNATQGTIAISGTTLSWNVGALASGAKATLTIVVTTITNGVLTTSATVAGAQNDPNPANNSATASTLVAPGGVAIEAAGATLTAESFTPPNGAIDIGETVTIILRLRNSSNVSTLNLVATLGPTNGVTPISPTTQTYGVLAPSGFPVGRAFTFTASGTNGQTISPTLQLHDGVTVYPPVTFNFTLPNTRTYTSTNAIAIRDNTSALPYPSTILVSGFSGTVGKFTATISNFTHTYAPDVDVLLVAPGGQDAMLMSNAGGNAGVVNATLTFDDSAASPVPGDGPIYSGSYQPANYLGNNMPGPAPAGPYLAAMSMFNGANPNGTWSLFVDDHTAGDTGSIAGGWSLVFTTITPVNQLADVSVSALATPDPIIAGGVLTYTFTIANFGPNSASSVAFTNILPWGVSLVAASASQGIVITNATTVLANLGSMASGASATVTVIAVPSLGIIPVGQKSVVLTNTANVASSETDPNPVNNSVSIGTTFQRPIVDLGVSLAVTPNPVATGNYLTNSIIVTNRGPGIALNVVLTEPLPAGTTFVPAISSPGCTNIGTNVFCALGDLAANTGVPLTVVLNVTNIFNTATLTNTVSVATASQNTNSANSTATTNVTVISAVLDIISAGAVLTDERGLVNGLVDPGEQVTVSFFLANVGSRDATTNLTATLQSTNGVTSLSGAQVYGALVHNGPAIARSFTFTNNVAVGGVVVATLRLTDESLGYTNSVPFVFNALTNSSWANVTAISIPDHGIGLPYPSSISVSNLPGVVTKATVTLKNLNHSFPHDISVLLVSPAGANVLLMSHAGGGHLVTNLTLTLDDAATNILSSSDALASLTYKPGSYPGPVAFFAPAPAAPYGSVLGGVNGRDPNGVWSLFVMDDTAGDSGSIAGGWGLDLTTAIPLRSFADLAVGMTSAPGSVVVGHPLTITVWVTNLGPASATGVMLTNKLSSGEQVVTTLGSLAVNASTKVVLQMTPSLGGSITGTADVRGNEVDLNLFNNSAQTSTTVIIPTQATLTGSIVSNQFRLILTADPGYTYAILASTNLNSWVSIGTDTTSPGGTIKFTDTNSPSLTRRYYRAQRLAP